jgi:hypothetical protein
VVVGNTSLTVMHAADPHKAGESEAWIAGEASWQNAPCSPDAERAAPALVEALLTPNPHGERVSAALFAEASRHYDEGALPPRATAIYQVCLFIPFALTGKPLPGVAPADQWTQ